MSDTRILPIERLKEELRDIELKVTTGFTLADAIREGAKHSQQAHGQFLSGGNACALAAGWISAKARGYAPE